MKILVTGANGQLGSELQKISAKNHSFQYIFTDYNELDITNANSVKIFFNEQKPDFLINCAAYTAVDNAENDYEKALLINSDAVANLADSCKTCDTIFLHISTDYVFDGKKPAAYLEDDKTNPISAYGKTKLLGEQHALAYSKSIIIRTSWLYSAFGNNFVKTMLRLGSELEKIKVVADQIGSPTYAEDLANAVLKIIETISKNPQNMKSGIYHFSNDGYCSWCDFAKEIMKLGNKNCLVEPISTAEYPTPAQRPQYSLLSKEKIKIDYGVDVPDWKIGLEKCINQLKDIHLHK
ncbi:MAG: dTDP-4-dehydrorhamnose reductase [Prevotellaceae bacterium]|jgi:dTDP-4-dehydrorhamnose reductase|nr:dTDP-4-dehydrorhamnose reductase [Prevotellaceae bacterium]